MVNLAAPDGGGDDGSVCLLVLLYALCDVWRQLEHTHGFDTAFSLALIAFEFRVLSRT